MDRRRAPAPAAAHADPHRCFLFRWHVRATGSLLGPSAAAPNGCSLPAAGLHADLDLSEPGLAYRGSAQQARAAHLDPQTTTTGTHTASGASRGAWHTTSLFFPVSWLSVLLSRSLSRSLLLPPSLLFLLPLFHSPHCCRGDALPPLSGNTRAQAAFSSDLSGFSSSSRAYTMFQYIHVFPQTPSSPYPTLPQSRDIAEC